MPEFDADRAGGVLLGCAAGDALGAGYEFAATVPDQPGRIGGGLGDFAPGEWTDDSAMAVAVADGLAEGEPLLAAIADNFLRWYALRAAGRRNPDARRAECRT